MLSRLDELGIRHIRDVTIGSWFDPRYYAQKAFIDALKSRNANLPAGRQPIFTLASTSQYAPNWTGPVHFTVNDWYPIFDGGHVHFNGDTGTNHCPNPPNGCNFILGIGTTLTEAQWPKSQPEIPWTLISAIQGPNEPQNNFSSLRSWQHDIFSQAKTHTTQVAQGDLPYVATDGIHSGAKVNTLPVIGPAFIQPSYNNQFGDATGANNYGTVDAGSLHPYRAGALPLVSHFANQFNQQSAYNGDLRSPADRSKAKPMFITEIGDVTDGVSVAGGVWPIPQDVQAEHTIRDFVLAYRYGIRRTYLFQLADSGDGAYGLVKSDNTRKQSFYAVKNLLNIVRL